MPQFKRGQSGNPAGRPKAAKDFGAACRERTPAALRALDAALKVPARAVRAAEVLLAYGYGKPTQPFAGSADFPPIGVDINETVHIYIPTNGRDRPDTELVADPNSMPPSDGATAEVTAPTKPDSEDKPKCRRVVV